MKILILIFHLLIIFLSGWNIYSGLYGYKVFIFFYSVSNLVNVLLIKKNPVLSTKIWSVIILIIPGILLVLGPILKIIGRLLQSKGVGTDWAITVLFGVFYLSAGILTFTESEKTILH